MMGVMKLGVRMRNVWVVVWIRVKGEVGKVVGRTDRSICLEKVVVGGRGVERGGSGAHKGERIGQRRVEGEQTAGAAAAVAAAELADDVDVIVLVHHFLLLLVLFIFLFPLFRNCLNSLSWVGAVVGSSGCCCWRCRLMLMSKLLLLIMQTLSIGIGVGC